MSVVRWKTLLEIDISNRTDDGSSILLAIAEIIVRKTTFLKAANWSDRLKEIFSEAIAVHSNENGKLLKRRTRSTSNWSNMSSEDLFREQVTPIELEIPETQYTPVKEQRNDGKQSRPTSTPYELDTDIGSDDELLPCFQFDETQKDDVENLSASLDLLENVNVSNLNVNRMKSTLKSPEATNVTVTQSFASKENNTTSTHNVLNADELTQMFIPEVDNVSRDKPTRQTTKSKTPSPLLDETQLYIPPIDSQQQANADLKIISIDSDDDDNDIYNIQTQPFVQPPPIKIFQVPIGVPARKKPTPKKTSEPIDVYELNTQPFVIKAPVAGEKVNKPFDVYEISTQAMNDVDHSVSNFISPDVVKPGGKSKKRPINRLFIELSDSDSDDENVSKTKKSRFDRLKPESATKQQDIYPKMSSKTNQQSDTDYDTPQFLRQEVPDVTNITIVKPAFSNLNIQARRRPSLGSSTGSNSPNVSRQISSTPSKPVETVKPKPVPIVKSIIPSKPIKSIETVKPQPVPVIELIRPNKLVETVKPKPGPVVESFRTNKPSKPVETIKLKPVEPVVETSKGRTTRSSHKINQPSLIKSPVPTESKRYPLRKQIKISTVQKEKKFSDDDGEYSKLPKDNKTKDNPSFKHSVSLQRRLSTASDSIQSTSAKDNSGRARLQRSVTQKPKILATRVDLSPYLKVITRTGSLIVTDPKAATVLICDQVIRTPKFLCALALGLPIVDTQYLRYMSIYGLIPAPERFIVSDQESEKRFGFVLTDSIRKAQSSRIFDGWTIFVTPHTRPEPLEMKDIIECGGGKCLLSIDKPTDDAVQMFAVTAKEDKPLWPKLRTIDRRMPLIHSEGLMMAVLRQEIDFRNFHC